MATIYDALKSQALRRLPAVWLEAMKGRHYFRVLRNFNVDDEPDMKVLPLLVPRGTVAVDLGANIGVYTKLLSELVAQSGTVLSVEPVPETFAILRGNVDRFGLGNVTLIEAAVSDAMGTATMSVPEYPSGGRNYYESQIVSTEAGEPTSRDKTVRVRTVTVDSIIEGRSSVSFIKCDVEGHEAPVVAGAASLIRSDHPAWLIEISDDPDRPGSGADILFERLAEEGYAAWLFDGTHLRKRERGDRSTNYFFLTAKHLERIQANAPNLIRRA